MADDMKSGSSFQESDLSSVFYREYYEKVFNSGGFVGWSYRKTHRAVEGNFRSNAGLSILEIGAGSGEHFDFVAPDFAKYTMVDLSNEPPNPVWRSDARVRWITGDVSTNILDGERFDRVISMCVLHHLDDVAGAFRNIRDWLKPGGNFSLFLPSDPGFLNRVNRSLFVTPRSRKLGFEEYPVFNAREHRNHYWGLKAELEYEFRGWEMKRVYWPLRLPLADLSVFSVWRITKPYGAGD